VIKQL